MSPGPAHLLHLDLSAGGSTRAARRPAAAPQGPSADSRAQIQSRQPMTPAGQVVLDEEPDVREASGAGLG